MSSAPNEKDVKLEEIHNFLSKNNIKLKTLLKKSQKSGNQVILGILKIFLNNKKKFKATLMIRIKIQT